MPRIIPAHVRYLHVQGETAQDVADLFNIMHRMLYLALATHECIYYFIALIIY